MGRAVIQPAVVVPIERYSAERTNRKRRGAANRLAALLGNVVVVPEPTAQQVSAARRLVVEKDAPVLAAALAADVDVLVTGDVQHFGAPMRRGDLPLRVRTPRAFLLEGP